MFLGTRTTIISFFFLFYGVVFFWDITAFVVFFFVFTFAARISMLHFCPHTAFFEISVLFCCLWLSTRQELNYYGTLVPRHKGHPGRAHRSLPGHGQNQTKPNHTENRKPKSKRNETNWTAHLCAQFAFKPPSASAAQLNIKKS